MKTLDATYAIMSALLEGGHTSWHSSETPTTSGFSVGDGRLGVKVSVNAEPQTLLEAIQELGRLAALEGFDGVGLWLNPEDGLLYLDPINYVASREDAVNLGRKRGEYAIYDLKTASVVDLT